MRWVKVIGVETQRSLSERIEHAPKKLNIYLEIMKFCELKIKKGGNLIINLIKDLYQKKFKLIPSAR